MSSDDTQEPVMHCYRRLQEALEDDNPADGLAAIDELQQSHEELMHDKDLNEARFACLIRLGKYTKVLENQPGHFQKAYCLFRLGRLEDALRECDECDDAHCSIALQHLRAQIHYRHKDFELSRAIYEKLIVADEDRKMDDDEYRLSLIANLYATSVASHDPSSALGLQDPEVIIAKEAEEAEMIGGCPHMELLYNVGSALIWDSQWYAAERALTLAEETCRKEMAQDGISEVEVSSELAMIMVQRAIALCRTDRNDEAKKVMNKLHEKKSLEPALNALVVNNRVVFESNSVNLTPKGEFDLLRHLRGALQRSSELSSSKAFVGELNQTQRTTMEANCCILLIRRGKLDEAKELLNGWQESDECSTILLRTTFHAAIAWRRKQYKECESLLRGLPDGLKLERDLLLYQLKALRGDIAGALEGLQTIYGVSPTQPAVIATVVAIKDAMGDKEGSIMTLLSGLEVLRNGGTSMENSPAILAIGHAILARGERKSDFSQISCRHTAAAAFSSLLEGNDESTELYRIALASLALTQSYFSVDKAKSSVSKLHLIVSLPQHGEGLDANELETTELPRLSLSQRLKTVDHASIKSLQRAEKKPQEQERRLRRRAKRREIYLDKLRMGDPKKQLPAPDSERWLPSSQRSHSKRGRKRNKFVGAQGAGGGGKGDVAKLDVAARLNAGESGVEEGVKTSTVSVVKQSGQGRRKRK